MDEEEKTASNNVLPSVSKDENIVAFLNSKEGKTSLPEPFTEGGLINFMKMAGRMVDDEAGREILKEL